MFTEFRKSPEFSQTTLRLINSLLAVNNLFLNVKVAVVVIFEELRNLVFLALAETLFNLCSRSSILASHAHTIPLPPEQLNQSASSADC